MLVLLEEIIWKNIFLFLVLLLSLTSGCKNNNAIKEISNEEAFRIIEEDKEILLLDVRSEQEYLESHIENAVLIPHTELDMILEKVLEKKHSKILIYCRTKNRSSEVANYLLDSGIENIYLMHEGYLEWSY